MKIRNRRAILVELVERPAPWQAAFWSFLAAVKRRFERTGSRFLRIDSTL